MRFWPEQAGIRSPSAICRADGTFSLECSAGSYRVTVTPRKPLGTAALPGPQAPGSEIPARFQDGALTPLRVTIVENDSDEKIVRLN